MGRTHRSASWWRSAHGGILKRQPWAAARAWPDLGVEPLPGHRSGGPAWDSRLCFRGARVAKLRQVKVGRPGSPCDDSGGGRRRCDTEAGVAATQPAKAGIRLAIPCLEVGVASDAHVHLRTRHHRFDAGFRVRAGGGVLGLRLAELDTGGRGGGWRGAASGHRSWRQRCLRR
jgi:hypothetical protein